MQSNTETEQKYTIGEKCTVLFFGATVTISGAGLVIESMNGNLPELSFVPDTVTNLGGLATGIAIGIFGANLLRGFLET